MKKIFITLCLFASFSMAYSETNDSLSLEPISVGGYLGGSFNFHSPNFNYPYGSSSAAFSDNANSLGINIGGIINYPITHYLTLSGRLGYFNIGGDLDGTSAIADTNFLHSIDASNHFIEFSPLLKINNLIPVENLYLLTGIELAFPVASSYSLNSSIESSSTLTFADGETSREDVGETDIPDASFRFGLVVGAGYNHKIDNHWTVSPELSFRLPFTDISSNANFDSWGARQLRLGVNLTYSFNDEPAPVDAESFITTEINGVYHYTKGGKRKEATRIDVEEVQYSELFPLVPYVFADLNSEYPNRKYQTLASESETGEFSIESLDADALSINNSTLDVIGKRMQKYPKAKLTIIGSLDGASEKGNKTLAQKRADFAKTYLVVNYSLNASNITTKALPLPERASTTRVADGVEENRRVEFRSNFPEILEPITIEKQKQTVSEPKALEFDVDIKSSDSITVWEFEISQSDKLIKRFSGTGHPNSISWNIKPNDLARNQVPVDYSLTAENSKGKLDSKSGTLPIYFNSYSRKQTEETPDKIISKFSLIVFPFNSDEISQEDERILRQNVLSAIKPNSVIQIYGYSDRIGGDDFNQKLALRRAKRVKKYLSKKAKNNKYEVYGIGENMKIYDNDSPVGRQLSRTVQIYVITPKQN